MYRELINAGNQTVPWWHLVHRRRVRQNARDEAGRQAAAETVARGADRDGVQQRLDRQAALLAEVQGAIDAAAQEWVDGEIERLERIRGSEQERLDVAWAHLCANEPDAVASALRAAYDEIDDIDVVGAADDGAVEAVDVPRMEDLIAEQEPALTPTGRPTVQPRGNTRRNELYLLAPDKWAGQAAMWRPLGVRLTPIETATASRRLAAMNRGGRGVEVKQRVGGLPVVDAALVAELGGLEVEEVPAPGRAARVGDRHLRPAGRVRARRWLRRRR